MHDPSVSKFHALIIRSENGTSIVDLGSENGMYINAEFTVDTQLRHLDVISVGSYRIKFSAQSDRNFDGTIALESVDEFRRALSSEPCIPA